MSFQQQLTAEQLLPLLSEEYQKALNSLVHLRSVTFASDVLLLSFEDIVAITGLPPKSVPQFLVAVSQQLFPASPVSAKELILNQPCRLSLGCPVLDAALQGGLLANAITEIAGESASGKTQLCLQLALQAQLPSEVNGLSGGTLFINTEAEFPVKRLIQLASFQKTKYPGIDFAGNIFVENVSTYTELNDLLERRLEALLRQRCIRLVIVDSLAALFRFEFSREEGVEKAALLWRHAHSFQLLSECHGCCVVVVNQVTDLLQPEQGLPIDDEWTGGLQVLEQLHLQRAIPSLGLGWSNTVNCRLFLSRTNDIRGKSPVRRLQVVYAPHLKSGTGVLYTVEESGIHGVCPISPFR